MATISKIRKCYNCGAILQSHDANKEGYVKEETLENPSQNFLFCDKCFEQEKYHASIDEPNLNPEFLSIIKDAKKKNALIVYVINLFSFESGFIHQVNEIINGMDILVIGNKFDLLPKGTNEEETCEYVAHRFRASGVKIESKNVVVANAFDEDTALDIITRIFTMKGKRDVYVVGAGLAGKTTLINSFLKVFSNLSKGNIVTEYYPNTSLRAMRIPLGVNSNLYETPGLGVENSILHNLDAQTTKKIYLTKAVESRKMKLNKGQAFYIGGLAMVEMLEGKITPIECYFHDDIQLKKVALSKAVEKFIKMNAKKALKPSLASIKSANDIDTYEIIVNENSRRDIGIQGLGWINFKANGQVFRISVPKGVSVYQSRPKVIKE